MEWMLRLFLFLRTFNQGGGQTTWVRLCQWMPLLHWSKKSSLASLQCCEVISLSVWVCVLLSCCTVSVSIHTFWELVALCQTKVCVRYLCVCWHKTVNSNIQSGQFCGFICSPGSSTLSDWAVMFMGNMSQSNAVGLCVAEMSVK